MNIPTDKKLHFLAGIIVCFVVALITKNPMYGLIGAVIAGIAKEIYDYYDYGKPDFADALATWLGGCAGFTLIALINYWK